MLFEQADRGAAKSISGGHLQGVAYGPLVPVSRQRLRDLPLWEPRFGHDKLVKLSRDPLSATTFDQGFRMRVIRPGDLAFPSFAKCWQPQLDLRELWARRLPCAIGVDLAGDKRPGNAIVAVGVVPTDRTRVLLEVVHGAWKSPDLVSHLADVCAHHDVQHIMVENNGYQQAVIDWIKASKKESFPWWMKIRPYTTTSQKHDPRYGLPGFEVEFANQGWAFPSTMWTGHDPGCACSWCLFDREFRTYPRGTTTDLVMASLFAKRAIDNWMWAPKTDMRLGDLNAR